MKFDAQDINRTRLRGSTTRPLEFRAGLRGIKSKSCRQSKLLRAGMSETMTPDMKRQKMEDDYKGYKKQFQEVDDISAAELHTLLANEPSKVALIDVRTPEERKVATIQQNVLTPDDFAQQKESLKDHTLITYCTAGLRSGKLAAKLRQDGYKVKNLKGSIIAWTQEGYPLVKGDGSGQPTKRVHAYGEHWAEQIGDGFEAETFSKPKGILEGVKSILPRWAGGGS